MFRNKINCSLPLDVNWQRDLKNNLFIQTVLEEDQRVKKLRAQEIQMTAENPRIRAQNETREISEQLKAYKHDSIVEAKRRQQLRQDNMELRQLAIQLRAAVVSKQLAEQKVALDRQKQADMVNKRKEDESLEKERLRIQEAMRQAEIEERRKKTIFRGVLLGQMDETKKRQQQEYEEVMKDREEMKKMLMRFQKEHEQELVDLERRKKEAKREMEEFQRIQEEYKKRQKSEDKSEFQRFLEITEKRDEDARREKENKRRQQLLKEELSNRIGQQLYETELKKRQRENLLLDLLVEERSTKEDMRFKENLQQQFENRKQMRIELERYQLELERRKMERALEEEEVGRAEQIRQKAEYDKQREQMDEKRRQQVRNHGEAIINMIEERRHLRALDAQDELQLHEFLQAQDRKKLAMVEDERMRILKSVPVDVLRYLPTGVIKESDRVVLGLTKK